MQQVHSNLNFHIEKNEGSKQDFLEKQETIEIVNDLNSKDEDDDVTVISSSTDTIDRKTCEICEESIHINVFEFHFKACKVYGRFIGKTSDIGTFT